MDISSIMFCESLFIRYLDVPFKKTEIIIRQHLFLRYIRQIQSAYFQMIFHEIFSFKYRDIRILKIIKNIITAVLSWICPQ